MPWPAEITLPENERAFRNKFWTEVIRGPALESGIHIERERTFVEIALRRARALTMFAEAANLDARLLQSLSSDSLIYSSETSFDLVAPAHDVLEDWAVIHWIDANFVRCNGSLEKLSELIGTHPAVRRSYRKWISELLERDSAKADDLFQALIDSINLPPQFSDDTLVSFLRSTHANTFLKRHEFTFFKDNNSLLRRIIHLLRVACVAPPKWLADLQEQPSIFNAPDSAAWAVVLGIVKCNLDTFKKETASLLLGFIEDWSRGVGWNSPYPDGADSAAEIAYHLLSLFDDYNWSEQRKRTLKVIAKIPKVDAQKFESILRRPSERGERDLTSDDLRAIVFEELDGMAACRDLPKVVMSVFWSRLFNQDEDETNSGFPQEWDDRVQFDHSRLFGLKRQSNLDYFPVSAFQGPFHCLLRHHFQDAVGFIIAILNKCGKAYESGYSSRGHAANTTELCFPDGTKRKQICDEMLWNIYRGQSTSPSVLQCALMALEKILLSYAEADAKELDNFLMSIIQQSETVAITSVASSVAIAHATKTPATIKVLLSSPECILLDRRRMSHDLSGSLSGLFPNFQAAKQIYYDERKSSDELEHRRNDLEFAVRTLQLGANADSVMNLIDKHLSNLPPLEKQGEFEQNWRLALHRMDLRQYTIEPFEEDNLEGEKQVKYLITARPPAEDLQSIVERTTVQTTEFNNIIYFKMWAEKVFTGDNSSSFSPYEWKTRLEQAKTISLDSPLDQFNAARTGAVTVAALCIRYHWKELAKTDQDWCINTVLMGIERSSNNWERLERVQHTGPEGGRAAAWVLPLLIGQDLSKKVSNRVMKCLAIAITHPVDEIRLHAIWGVGAHLWKTDRAILLRCINAIATEATLIENRMKIESQKPYSKRSLPDAIHKEVTKLVRKGFYDDAVVLPDAYEKLDATGGNGAYANCRIISIMQESPTEPIAVECFQRATRILADWWKAERKGRGRSYHEIESQLMRVLEEFLFGTSADDAKAILSPILGSINEHPDKIHWLVLGLLGVEDRAPKPDRFWFLWDQFADCIANAAWMKHIQGQYSHGENLVYAIFLVTRWKENVRHWKSLEGYANKIDDLFLKLPPSPLVLHAYCSFLYHIGERSVPHAFTLIADNLKSGNAQKMLTSKGDTIFMLETLLQRHVYGKPIELKTNEKRRESVLYLLDQLIENGSSASYRMRDDFVTPMSLTPVGA
ncbi:AAA family ATPase [Patescibacteria group bacterium]|nr:AAA family ATPase [Patescibacteria group bacterium]